MHNFNCKWDSFAHRLSVFDVCELPTLTVFNRNEAPALKTKTIEATKKKPDNVESAVLDGYNGNTSISLIRIVHAFEQIENTQKPKAQCSSVIFHAVEE